MNRYLLDTHILLWWLANDKNLSKEMITIISNPNSTIIVSTTTIWEIVIKKSLGKLNAPNNIQEVIYENNFDILPIIPDHVLYLEKLPPIHHDPFDRLLIAQSIVENLIFITADKVIPKYTINCL